MLNIVKNKSLKNIEDNKIFIVLLSIVSDYVNMVLYSKYIYHVDNYIQENLFEKLKMSKIKCGIQIHGCLDVKIKEIEKEKHKLLNFLKLFSSFWTTIMHFVIVIFNNNTLNSKIFFSIFTIVMFCLLLYFLIS